MKTRTQQIEMSYTIVAYKLTKANIVRKVKKKLIQDGWRSASIRVRSIRKIDYIETTRGRIYFKTPNYQIEFDMFVNPKIQELL